MSKVSFQHAAANNLERSEHVRRQLERRREVLAEWVAIGVSSLPEGRVILALSIRFGFGRTLVSGSRR